MKLPQKQTIETLKTVVISILITGIVAFLTGMKYQEAQTAHVHAEAKALTTALKR